MEHETNLLEHVEKLVKHKLSNFAAVIRQLQSYLEIET
jgi:hypothetical protein